MILSTLEKFSFLIKSYEIQQFKTFGGAYKLVLVIELKDGSELHVRDFLFSESERKYSYHWQDKFGKCKRRWDNAPHHREIDTYPYHVHVGRTEKVHANEPMTLERVLEYIGEAS